MKSFGEEIEDDTIGDLHPDEDDLFSGVTDALGSIAHAKTTDDFEDFDLFSSGRGMELEGDELLVSGKRISGLELDGDPAYFGGSKGKSPFGEQSSRTLFQYGGYPNHLHCLQAHQGFLLVSYNDLRAALQNRSLNSRNLDVHYSFPKGNASEKDIGHGTLMISCLDPSVLKNELKHIFGFYGETKEIYEYPDMNHIKYIEFYDVRGVSSGVIASGGSLENGYNHRFQSESQLPLNAFIDNTIFHSISNAARGAFAVTVSDARESSNAVDTMKFASIPSFRPHSLPEYRDGLANGSPYNLSNTIKMAANIGTGSTEASDRRHIQGMSSTGNLA
ncbi:protein MEI2 [Trifolium repens]|nr:protein MEI2 [Trifolium repens]